MATLDIIQIADLKDEQRAAQMGKLFGALWSQPEEQRISGLRGMLEEMASKASDHQYLRLCATNLSIAATLGDAELRQFLADRSKATEGLPTELRERCASHVSSTGIRSLSCCLQGTRRDDNFVIFPDV